MIQREAKGTPTVRTTASFVRFFVVGLVLVLLTLTMVTPGRDTDDKQQLLPVVGVSSAAPEGWLKAWRNAVAKAPGSPAELPAALLYDVALPSTQIPLGTTRATPIVILCAAMLLLAALSLEDDADDLN